MRHEKTLCAIYERWLARPGNRNVPKLSADEALYEVVDDLNRLEYIVRFKPSNMNSITTTRRIWRMRAQRDWLGRFINIWNHFEDNT